MSGRGKQGKVNIPKRKDSKSENKENIKNPKGKDSFKSKKSLNDSLSEKSDASKSPTKARKPESLKQKDNLQREGEVLHDEKANSAPQGREKERSVERDLKNVDKSADGKETGPSPQPEPDTSENVENRTELQNSTISVPKDFANYLRRLSPNAASAKFLETLEASKGKEEFFVALRKNVAHLSMASCSSVHTVLAAPEARDDELVRTIMISPTTEDFKQIYKINLPFQLGNESVRIDHDYGPQWDRLLNRIYDCHYLEAFHLNYPRRDSVDAYAMNLTWLKSLLTEVVNFAQKAKSINPERSALMKLMGSNERNVVDDLVKNEFRASLLQRVRNDAFLDDQMYEDTVTSSINKTLYSPYFTTGEVPMEESEILTAELMLTASLLFLKISDDALHNGRLLSCVSYGRMGLCLAKKFESLTREKDSFTALELLFFQRLTTALVRTTLYADLTRDTLPVFGEIAEAFEFMNDFLSLHGEEISVVDYMSSKNMLAFIATLIQMRCHAYDDPQLMWERHFLLVLRSARTINYHADELNSFTDLANLTDKTNLTLNIILDTIMDLDSWEDHLCFYTSHNLAARTLFYKAQIIGLVAEFVTDYKACYQYALTKLVKAIDLETKNAPNLDVKLHRHCVNSFKRIQLDAALRMMWEFQSTTEVHETIGLLQRVMECSVPTWILRRNEDLGHSILASVLLLDYLSGLSGCLDESSAECMKKLNLCILKETAVTDAVRDAVSFIVWDKIESLWRVKREQNWQECLRILKTSYYTLPTLLYSFSDENSESLKQIYEDSIGIAKASLLEAKDHYTHTKDPNFVFSQKMLHDFTQNWSTAYPNVRPQAAWPKPPTIENSDEFECGEDRAVYFMMNHAIGLDKLHTLLQEPVEKLPFCLSRKMEQTTLNTKDLQSALATATAQFAIRSNKFEMGILKNQLSVDLKDHDGYCPKINNFNDLIVSVLALLTEMAFMLEEKRKDSKLPRDIELYEDWAKKITNVVTRFKEKKGKDSVCNVVKLLLDVAFTFGFAVKKHLDNILEPEEPKDIPQPEV